jgi:zinc D-Ala-D-Ala carboxypeptidase
VTSSPGKRGALSLHFNAQEFACPHCGVAVVDPRLVTLLEAIRAVLRGPVRVLSGYRCPVHNHDVGGAADSQHMYGTAADIPPGLVSPASAHRLGAIGVGRKGTSAVHVDVRSGPSADWSY